MIRMVINREYEQSNHNDGMNVMGSLTHSANSRGWISGKIIPALDADSVFFTKSVCTRVWHGEKSSKYSVLGYTYFKNHSKTFYSRE